MDALLAGFRERIRAGTPLVVRGGGSKDFYGGAATGNVLDVRAWQGIANYEPSELVITARAGTPLAEVESRLAAQGQCLAFEPPRFGAGGTIGGMVACGLSGPRRMSVGALRDFVLGVTIMDGNGRVLKFGGEVMKNVAGFDVSRLMAGSMGTLGVLLDVSVKVLPVPVADATVVLAMNEADALQAVNQWAGQPLPLAATCWSPEQGGMLAVRLAGARAAVEAAARKIGGEPPSPEGANYSGGGTALWASLRDHTHAFFAGDAPLWRLAVPSTAPALDLGPTLVEWGGGQRWLRGEFDARSLRETVAKAGGHATLFRGGDKSVGVFTPTVPAIAALQQRLRAAFDPHGVFNAGRLYPAVP